ncbi:hypothetical protein HDV05_001504 [Chytridiales sp. JEL 0842]|nr:hypothetical protein HDV05_001504 [Chytridiales sp. JEL 0842]
MDSPQKKDTFEYHLSSHLKLNGVYWALTSLCLLGKPDALPKEDVISYVLSCHHPNGGFGGDKDHDPHLLYTLSAIQILATLDALDRLPSKPQTVSFISELQTTEGSFKGDEYGETDTRFTYCALSALSILKALDKVDVEKAVEFLGKCMNFDGGFGSTPGGESHSGQIFCCVAALAIVDCLHLISSNDDDRLSWWLAERQLKNGGLNGRPEKLEDDEEGGGIADRPGDVPDIFHTLFGIAGLSLLGFEGLESVDPRYCMPVSVIKRLGL